MKKKPIIKISGIETSTDFSFFDAFKLDIYSFSTSSLELMLELDMPKDKNAIKLYGLSTNDKKKEDISIWENLSRDKLFLSEFILNNKIGYLEITERLFFPNLNFHIDLLKKLKNLGIKIIYSGMDWSYDFFPADPFQTTSKSVLELIDYFQIELLTDNNNSWEFFKTECTNENNASLTLKDIQNLSKNHPLILSLNFNDKNILDILTHFPEINGINFSVTSCNNFYEHVQVKSDILNTLKIMNSKFGFPMTQSP